MGNNTIRDGCEAQDFGENIEQDPLVISVDEHRQYSLPGTRSPLIQMKVSISQGKIRRTSPAQKRALANTAYSLEPECAETEP